MVSCVFSTSTWKVKSKFTVWGTTKYISYGTLNKSLNNQVYTHCVMHNKVYITAHWTRVVGQKDAFMLQK